MIFLATPFKYIAQQALNILHTLFRKDDIFAKTVIRLAFGDQEYRVVEGVNLKSLLITEPHPGNPLLADIAKRIGLAERTGRGIDRIYSGLLRYGRPAPDYSRSDATSVILCMCNAESDMDFLKLIIQEENRQGGSMPLDSLIKLLP